MTQQIMRKLIVSFAFMVITLTSYAQVYKMYKTQNYHNQLRLNTMTSEVQQIQDEWSTKGDDYKCSEKFK